MKIEKIWDVFISHASEDKPNVARPLANKLAESGMKVWLDEAELFVGDRLREKIDHGLGRSQFGVVILSPSFFAKEWTQSELDALVSKEVGGRKVILPIWHDLGFDDVQAFSPILAGRLGVPTAKGLDFVRSEIVKAINEIGNKRRREHPIFAGNMTRKALMSLPEGSVLMSNGVNPDFTPILAEELGPVDTREQVWAKLKEIGYAGKRCYVFGDWAGYREHLASRLIWTSERGNA